MALLHHSTATRTEEPMTDVMASNATVVPAPDTSFDPRDRDFEEASVMRVPGSSVGSRTRWVAPTGNDTASRQRREF